MVCAPLNHPQAVRAALVRKWVRKHARKHARKPETCVYVVFRAFPKIFGGVCGAFGGFVLDSVCGHAVLALHTSYGYANTFVRAACLQNETAPKNFNFKTKNGPKNAPKLPRNILSLLLLCRISHRHYSKIFHREFPHKIKYCEKRRESAGMATLTFVRKRPA